MDAHRRDAMISTQAFAALRVAATLTHSMPGLRTRVRSGDTVLVEVGVPHPAEPPPTDQRQCVSPCAFRRAVATAYEQHATGRPITIPSLAEGLDPSVDIGVPPDGLSRPGGLYRVPLAGRWLWGFATTLDPRVAYEAGLAVVSEGIEAVRVETLGIRPDPATGVSLAFAETAPHTTADEEEALVDLLEGLLACWTAQELLASLEGAGYHSTP